MKYRSTLRSLVLFAWILALALVPAVAEKPTTYARPDHAWPFSSGPRYGEVEPADRRAPGVLITAVGSFHLGRDGLRFPEQLMAVDEPGKETDRRYFIVQVHPDGFADGTFEALGRRVEDHGGKLLIPMPIGAFVARLSPAAVEAVSHLPGLLAIERYHPALKLHPEIGRAPHPDRVAAASEVYDLDVVIFPGEDPGQVAASIAAIGGKVTSVWPDTVRAQLHHELLPSLAALEPVRMVFEHLPVFGQAEESSNVIQIGRWDSNARPYHLAGVRGAGEVLMVLDSGFSADAGELSHTRIESGDVTPGFGVGHRKILVYESTNQFGGSGDLESCDYFASGGESHGHVVASVALGNATDVDISYGQPWEGIDGAGNSWSLDGVAPDAKLVGYDGFITPQALPCGFSPAIVPGDLYSAPSGGSLGESYVTHGARVANFSWGSGANVYEAQVFDIDDFLFQKKDGMVFVSAGNAGGAGSLSAPATTKNGLAIGATGTANDSEAGGDQDDLAQSGSGPTPAGRIAPQLMAPGADLGNLGLRSEFVCVSSDNDNTNPVECDVVEATSNTSYAAAAAAGAGLLVRSYFDGGFYPDGTDQNVGNSLDVVGTISGALLKSILIASADWVGEGNDVPDGSLGGLRYRFSNEQGYGRIQLNNVLPLESYSSPVGLIAVDGEGVDANSPMDLQGGNVDGVVTQGATDQTTFEVCDDDQEIRVALSWIESSGDALINDLDLEVQSPSGDLYYGNYFTDDDDRDGELGAGEDCPSLDGSSSVLDQSPWSLATCINSERDSANPTEAIFLSPDPDANGMEGSCSITTGTLCFSDGDCPVSESCNGSLSQIEAGSWTIRVIGSGVTGSQSYAVAIAGGVCRGSSVRLDEDRFTCNGRATITVNEFSEPSDPGGGLTVGEISGRTLVEVVDIGPDGQVGTGDDVVTDFESVPTFVMPDPAVLSYEAADLVLTDRTAPDPGNGALDVRHGNVLRVTYADEVSGVPDLDLERRFEARIDCAPQIRFGIAKFGQIGSDSPLLVEGGCELNARGGQEFGFPDRYLDAGEQIGLKFLISQVGSEDLIDATASLRCVLVDMDSPADCLPGSDDCADPDRENNPDCAGLLTILDSPKSIGDVPVGAVIAPVFSIQMASSIAGEPKVEFVLGIESSSSGLTTTALAVSRQKLDVDEFALFYSTSFPTGGTEEIDWNNDEILENPTTSGVSDLDYRFETRTWDDLTLGGTRNTSISAPWNFDLGPGGFTTGRGAASSAVGVTIALWGEDLDFDGVLDAGEDRDPVNGLLDQSWSDAGGCGWQSRAPGTCSGGIEPCYFDDDCPPAGTRICNTGVPQSTGGVWHTGRIDSPFLATCLGSGGTPAQCQAYETIPGTSGGQKVYEYLLTPIVEKVNLNVDGEGDPVYEARILDWRWNALLDLPDAFATFTWELDTDVDAAEPINLTSDATVLGLIGGPYGAVSGGGNPGLTDGYPMFAPLDPSRTISLNGSVGNNRVGDNSCWFEGGNVSASNALSLGLSGPPDDDLDNDVVPDAVVDEYVTADGPLRNFGVSDVNGPDMRFDTIEDIYGPTGERFQGALGFTVQEGDGFLAAEGFGVTIDDMTLEWQEVRLDPDGTLCGAQGVCAVLELQSVNVYRGSTRIEVTLQESSPSGNDCDDIGGTDDPPNFDCDGDGNRDVRVTATSEAERLGERFLLHETSPSSDVYRGSLPISAAFDTIGTLFVERNGTLLPSVAVIYEDEDDGFGGPCENDPDPGMQGRVIARTDIFIPVGRIVVKSVRLTDDNDNDGIADTNETVDMFITIANKSGMNLDDVVARLSTNDPNIDCIIDPIMSTGSLGADEVRESVAAFRFKVGDVERTTEFEELTATFNITLASAQFDGLIYPQEVTLDLDLDIVGGASPTSFLEDFEVTGNLGSFTMMSLDENLNSNALSDGYRCQYHDPDFANSNSFGEPACFLGPSNPVLNTFPWHEHGSSSGPGDAPDGGRAASGSGSLHYGVHEISGDPDGDTTPLATLDAVRLTNPVSLGWNGVVPELSFKHQISLVDDRSANVSAGETVDRAVVQVQLADGSGVAQGPWIRLEPYHNVYDSQATDDFNDCTFDPIDDGSDEDDYFDPSDPGRRLGPSTMCYTQTVFANLGDTDYTIPFSPTNVGRASDGPGIQGSFGPGTWVESRFSLERFRGRRIRVRFIVSSIEVGGGATTYRQLGWNSRPEDDGWYIDDLQISDTLLTAATVVPDTSLFSGTPCGSCSTVTASLSAVPSVLDAPGSLTSLGADSSVADRCLDGTLQYQFWIDDGDTTLGNGSDVLVRDWTDDPGLAATPLADTTYGVKVRCSSDPACGPPDDATVAVTVNCPASGNLGGNFQSMSAPDNDQFVWTTPDDVTFVQGELPTLASFSVSDSGTLANTTSLALAPLPMTPVAEWYLVRSVDEFCNNAGSWGTPGRDAALP